MYTMEQLKDIIFTEEQNLESWSSVEDVSTYIYTKLSEDDKLHLIRMWLMVHNIDGKIYDELKQGLEEMEWSVTQSAYYFSANPVKRTNYYFVTAFDVFPFNKAEDFIQKYKGVSYTHLAEFAIAHNFDLDIKKLSEYKVMLDKQRQRVQKYIMAADILS